MARNADGRLEVFRMSPTGKVRHVRQTAVDGPWSAWEDLGGAFGSRAPVRPVLRADGRLEVSVLSSAEAVDDALLWSKEQLEPGGPDWSPGWRGADLGIPGPVPDRSAAVVGSHADGRPVVLTGIFETGETTVWLTERTATGGHARQLTHLPASGRTFARPELVRDATGRLVLLWIGDLDTLVRGLRQTEPNGETWSPFTIELMPGG